MGYGIDTVVNAATVLYLLTFEGHEDGCTLRCQRPDCLDPAQAVRQHGIQAVLLLIFEDGELTASCPGLQGFRVLVKLFQTVGQMGQRHHGEHHALVALRKVIHILFSDFSHLLHLIGQVGRKVVVGVLALLPAVGVGIHGHDNLIHHLDGFIHTDGDNINGQHHVSGIVHQLGNHIVLDKAGIIAQKQGAPEVVAHFVVALMEGQAIRRNGIFEAMSTPHGFCQVKTVLLFLAGTEEVMKQAQALVQIDLPSHGVHAGQTGGQVCPDTVEKGFCVLQTFRLHGNGNVLLLNEIIAVRCLVREKVVVLHAELIQSVSLEGHQQCAAELLLIESTVKQGDLRRSIDRQSIEKRTICHEQLHLLFRRGHLVIDIKKAPSF